MEHTCDLIIDLFNAGHEQGQAWERFEDARMEYELAEEEWQAACEKSQISTDRLHALVGCNAGPVN